MWNADKLGYQGNTNYNRAYEGSELVWEKQGPGPTPVVPNDEILYTSTDENIITPTNTGIIISNTYSDGIGVIKFASSVTNIGDNNILRGFALKTTLETIILPNNSISLCVRCFYNCTSLKSIVLPTNITFNKMAYLNNSETFFGCTNLTNIIYTGTIAQWDVIEKGKRWNLNVPATVVHCSDGDVPI